MAEWKVHSLTAYLKLNDKENVVYCVHCKGRIFTSDHDCLERFITDHQDCEATK